MLEARLDVTGQRALYSAVVAESCIALQTAVTKKIYKETNRSCFRVYVIDVVHLYSVLVQVQ